jgi:hypothetical protein
MIERGGRGRLGYVAIVVVAGVLLAAWVVVGLRRDELPVPGAQAGVKAPVSATATQYESPIMGQETVEANMEAKRKGVEEAEAAQQTADAGPRGSKEVPTQGPDEAEATPGRWRSGITFVGSLPSGYGAYYEFSNAWAGVVDGSHVDVNAGAVWDVWYMHLDTVPEQGLVQVWMHRGERLPAVDNYESPYRCGVLEVISEDAGRLLLVSTTKPVWFEFDVKSRAWTRFGVIDTASGQPVYREAEPPCAKQGEVSPLPTPRPAIPTEPVRAP